MSYVGILCSISHKIVTICKIIVKSKDKVLLCLLSVENVPNPQNIRIKCFIASLLDLTFSIDLLLLPKNVLVRKK